MVIINKKKILSIFLTIIFILFLVFFSVFLFLNNSKNVLAPQSVENIKYLKIGEQKIKIKLATTSETQEKGLSGRKEIKNDEGMLFVFKNSGKYSFWMKDMNFPIDMIWLDDEMKIVFIKNNVLPSTFPETFSPTKDSKYVLELIAGFAQKNNLKEGEVVKFVP